MPSVRLFRAVGACFRGRANECICVKVMYRIFSAEIVTMSNISGFQSEYLHVGRKCEDWSFRDVQFVPNGLTALMDISSPYVSSHDRKGFHLSIFTTQEACVELLVLWTCHKACLKSKPGEAWMKEISSIALLRLEILKVFELNLMLRKVELAMVFFMRLVASRLKDLVAACST